MNFIPHLTFNGDCKQALEYYAKVFGGTIDIMKRFEDVEQFTGMPKHIQKRIMYASLTTENGKLLASDDPTGNYQLPQSMHIAIRLATLKQAQKAFKQLSKDGEVMMPFKKLFSRKALVFCVINLVCNG